MRTLCVGLLYIVIFPAVWAAHKAPTSTTFQVKIEATELDRQMLLEKLNANGAYYHLKFVVADQDFDYRITFATRQAPVGTRYGDVNASRAITSVFDSKGTELFEFNRQGRWTDSGATNAAAKEIIKRLLKLKSTSRPN
jgi:hypothetical protein